MAYPIWVTPAGSLGTISENEYWDLQLDSYNPGGGSITYTHIAGALPPGIQLIQATGGIQGVPVVTEAANLSATYKFTIRATNALGKITDRTFTLTINNIIPPEITPRDSFLASIFDNEYFSLQLLAIEVNSQASLTWSLSSGTLPPGLSLSTTGLISGFVTPIPVTGVSGETGYSNLPYNQFGYDNSSKYRNSMYQFTVRVFDGANYDTISYTISVTAKGAFTADNSLDFVDDAYLTIDSDNRYLPIILTPPQDIPSIRSNSKFAFKVDAYDPIQDVLQFGSGATGIAGYDYGIDGNDVYDLYSANTQAVVSFTQSANANVSYYSIDHTRYLFDIIKPGNISIVNNTALTVNSVNFVWASNLAMHPLTFTTTTTVGTYVATYNSNTVITATNVNCISSNFTPVESGYVWANISLAYSNDPTAHLSVIGNIFGTNSEIGYDNYGYDQDNSEFPIGITIDPDTGWIYGTVPSQPEASKVYNFNVTAFKRDAPSYSSAPSHYTMTVLGGINDYITWSTSADLGVITNGSISELAVSAFSGNTAKTLTYSLMTDSQLPQGLKLLPSGLITGRATFRYFTLDGGNTTIDRSATSIDNVYNFTVLAKATDESVSSTKTFTVTVDNYNQSPYENLYLAALPSESQRQTFLDIVNNDDLFPAELIYRIDDPWFGRAKSLRSLFLPGLTPSAAAEYIAALGTNHFNKRIEFGNVKTARATDENFNVQYEVVYLELLDLQTDQGRSPADSQLLNVTNFYNNNPAFNTFYPNAFDNMVSKLSNSIGYANEGALPTWMTSAQADGKSLGLTHAIVLAYTVKDASELIAYRLNASKVKFGAIDFVLDRYQWDNYLSQYYDSLTGSFLSSAETTFDQIPRINVVTYNVSYALTGRTFDSINNQTVSAIRDAGGLDGAMVFNTGDLLVFAEQDNYPNNTSPNDGWNLVTGAGSTVIPGYFDHFADPLVPNQRIGIWAVNVSASLIVTLEFVQTVEVNDRIQVNNGETYGGAILYYDISQVPPGHSVPQYSSENRYPIATKTRFDGYGTKFIDKRDTYSPPGADDKYLKFTKNGVFI